MGGLIGIATNNKSGLMGSLWIPLISITVGGSFKLFSLDISKPCHAVIEVGSQSPYGEPNIYRYSFMRNKFYDKVQKKKIQLCGTDIISPIRISGVNDWDIYATINGEDRISYIKLIEYYNINIFWTTTESVPTDSKEF